MPFPGLKGSFPGKDEMADYLKRDVKEYSLPVKLNMKVNHLFAQNNYYEIDTPSNCHFQELNLITGMFHYLFGHEYGIFFNT